MCWMTRFWGQITKCTKGTRSFCDVRCPRRWTDTVEQQIFTCRKFSRISRISQDSRNFPARECYCSKVEFQSETTVGKLRTSTFQKFANISCTRIACARNSRKFPVANFSCSTVAIGYLPIVKQVSLFLVPISTLWPRFCFERKFVS